MLGYYALDDQGHIIYLGKYETFDDADMGHTQAGVIWIFDEIEAQRWVTRLTSLLGANA